MGDLAWHGLLAWLVGRLAGCELHDLGFLGFLVFGFLVSWLLSFLVSKLLGVKVCWFLGFKVSWFQSFKGSPTIHFVLSGK